MANFSFPNGSTLKALLEDPNLQVAPVPYNNSNKLKQEKEGGAGNGAGFDLASAAFLGPSLWDKTYDNADFNLEYMDLDEFLMENTTQAWTDPQALSPPMPSSSSSTPPHVSPPRVSPGVPPVVSPQASPRAPPPSPPQVSSELAAALMQIPAPKPKTLPPQGWNDRGEMVHVDFAVSDSDLALARAEAGGGRVAGSLLTGLEDEESDDSEAEQPDLPTCRAPSLCGMERWLQHEGEEEFDPRRRQFSEEELKPQPMIKKSKKIFVPNEAKDDKYWARRHKNNMAAKRSRDARRIKENQIAMRAAFLEKENKALRTELDTMRSENMQMKMALKKYEGGS